MKYVPKILILLILILNINKKERVLYLPFDIQGPQMAATIPPFGIFIEEENRHKGDVPGSILWHEKVHWNQYQEMGLIKFYFTYLTLYAKHGRFSNWMEKEARQLSR